MSAYALLHCFRYYIKKAFKEVLLTAVDLGLCLVASMLFFFSAYYSSALLKRGEQASFSLSFK